jgi:glutamate synthase (NADPH/NADH) small chain
MCVPRCPVAINIPGFIQHVKNREFAEAARVFPNPVHSLQYAAGYAPRKCNVKANAYWV